MIKGGYGGGSSANFFSLTSLKNGTGSGGGQSAVKFLENDLWHRVIVSGGGGGCDDSFGTFGGDEDGSGGAGGNLTAQSWFQNGKLVSIYLATSSSGFTFGTGEAARYGASLNSNAVKNSYHADNAGAGGGWFGGFASQAWNAGAGGGSSWALTYDAFIPSGLIDAADEFYQGIKSKKYAFTKQSGYLFEEVENVPGIWNGNGRIIITILGRFSYPSCSSRIYLSINLLLICLFMN